MMMSGPNLEQQCVLDRYISTALVTAPRGLSIVLCLYLAMHDLCCGDCTLCVEADLQHTHRNIVSRYLTKNRQTRVPVLVYLGCCCISREYACLGICGRPYYRDLAAIQKESKSTAVHGVWYTLTLPFVNPLTSQTENIPHCATKHASCPKKKKLLR